MSGLIGGLLPSVATFAVGVLLTRVALVSSAENKFAAEGTTPASRMGVSMGGAPACVCLSKQASL